MFWDRRSLYVVIVTLCKALSASFPGAGEFHLGAAILAVIGSRTTFSYGGSNSSAMPGDALLSSGSEDVIPKRRADAIGRLIILIVVAQLILFEPRSDTPLHGKVMGSVMNRIVTNVTQSEPGGNCRSESSEKEREGNPEYKGQRNAHARRHNEPSGVVRIIVMNTVDNKVQLPAHFVLRS
jgi:hypothetical protein